MFYVGLDLGQTQDYTALAVIEHVGQADYHARHLERFELGTPYPEIVRRVSELMTTAPLANRALLIVDKTGVGAPVVDLLEDLRPEPVVIHGGDRVTQEGGDYRVPKRDLISTVQVLLQNRALKFAASLPEVPRLVDELLSYRVKISEAGHDTYNAREGAHDDLVLAVALAAWYADRIAGEPVPPGMLSQANPWTPSRWTGGRSPEASARRREHLNQRSETLRRRVGRG